MVYQLSIQSTYLRNLNGHNLGNTLCNVNEKNIINLNEICNLYEFPRKMLQSPKTFFWFLTKNFAIFSCKMIVTCESGQHILCLETSRRRPKKISSKKKSQKSNFI